MDLFQSVFSSFYKPRWREEFEYKMYDLEKRTGLTKYELKKVADALEELKIIQL
jgi:hypothetical protein